MPLTNALIWTALSTIIKISASLLVIKILAITFGPDGLGQAGNYRQLVTVLGMLSGAGIFNGMTRLVAEHQNEPERLRAALGTGSAMVLTSSLILASMLIFAADLISYILFGHERYRGLIITLAIIQLGIACANLGLAILKGYCDAAGNAFVVSSGSILGIAAFFVCYRLGGYSGALAGLGLLPAMTMIPAAFVLWYQRHVPLSFLLPAWKSDYAALLSKFTIMTLITIVTLPVAYIMMRNLLVHREGWVALGIWQGISSISDAYSQFITALFTVYLLPTLSQLTDKQAAANKIILSLRFILPIVTVISLTIWLLRDAIIKIFFSSEFREMSNLFIWQLIGDILKVGAYIFGYLVIARAELLVYLLAEITQFILLTGFSYWLIPNYGALGATQAYMATYIVYFMLCSSLFYSFFGRNE